MSEQILYLYAIGREFPHAAVSGAEAIDGGATFEAVEAAGLTAIFTPVPREEFSQDEIDRRAEDLQWLGTIGYRHQSVVAQLAAAADVIPLRAFTLFSSPPAVAEYLEANRNSLSEILSLLDGKEEWTIRIEFDPQRWSEALARRVESLAKLEAEVAAASGGKQYLLRRKFDDERKKAAREAETLLVDEIEKSLVEETGAPTVVETRQSTGGSFPQITLLLARSNRDALTPLHERLSRRYEAEGVTLVLTGPWPAYTFAAGIPHD